MALQPTTFAAGPRTENGQAVWEEYIALPASGTKLSGAITGLKANFKTLNHYVSFRIQFVGTLAGTNVDIDLMGGYLKDGTDAGVAITNLVTALTGTTAAFAVKDINLTPYPWYFIRCTVDTSEIANAVKVTILNPE
jgi:hypothetical protein